MEKRRYDKLLILLLAVRNYVKERDTANDYNPLVKSLTGNPTTSPELKEAYLTLKDTMETCEEFVPDVEKLLKDIFKSENSGESQDDMPSKVVDTNE